MASLTIKIEKEDITTSKLGNNIMVNVENIPLALIFTPESLEELISDYNLIKNGD